MKYIITGGSGFIGKHFSMSYSKDIIYNFDIENSEVFNNHRKVDILDKEKLLSFKTVPNDEICLIHMAAVHFDFQKNYYQTNITGTKNVLEFVKKNKIKKFIFFSSVAVYGDSQLGKDEESEKEPNNDYGKSKLEAERVVENWSKNNKFCQVIIVRPAVVFGEFNFGNVYNLIQQIKSGFYFVIGNGDNIKSIAYVKNLVDSVIFTIENVKENYYVYNYCDYPQNTTMGLSLKISKILNKTKPFKIPYFLTKIVSFPLDIIEKIFNKDLKFNSMRLKKFTISTNFKSDRIRKFGFTPRYNTIKSLQNTINWIIKNDVKKMRKKWFKKASKL